MTFYANDVCETLSHWSFTHCYTFNFNEFRRLTKEQEILSTFIDPYVVKKKILDTDGRHQFSTELSTENQ